MTDSKYIDRAAVRKILAESPNAPAASLLDAIDRIPTITIKMPDNHIVLEDCVIEGPLTVEEARRLSR